MRSFSPAVSRRRRRAFRRRSTPCDRWVLRSACTRPVHIRAAWRESCQKSIGSGIDIKAPIADYAAVTGIPGSGLAALSSLDRVREARVDCEVRTTVHPALDAVGGPAAPGARVGGSRGKTMGPPDVPGDRLRERRAHCLGFDRRDARSCAPGAAVRTGAGDRGALATGPRRGLLQCNINGRMPDCPRT